VAGYKPRGFTARRRSHPSTNRARCRVTSLTETNGLPLSQATTELCNILRWKNALRQNTLFQFISSQNAEITLTCINDFWVRTCEISPIRHRHPNSPTSCYYCNETQSSPLLSYFMSGIRPFYSVAKKQTTVRAHNYRPCIAGSFGVCQ